MTSRIVALYNNYAAIPFQLKPVSATGNAMRLVPLGAEVLAPYWSEFGPYSKYKVLLAAETSGVCLTTKNGERSVGAIARSKSSAGTLVLLPDMDFWPEHFLGESNSQGWTDAATQFASRLLSTVVALDKALHSTAEITPEPEWASDTRFALASEQTARSELLEAERLVEKAQRGRRRNFRSAFEVPELLEGFFTRRASLWNTR